MANTVTVAQTGSVQEIAFEEGMTIAEALKLAGLTVGSGYQVRLNGATEKNMDTKLRVNDTVLVVGQIRGA